MSGTLAIQDVALQEINGDTRLSYRMHALSPELKRSIETYGVFQPLLVVRTSEGYLIADGFLRYEIAHRLGKETLPVKIFPSQGEAFLASVGVNHSHHPLSVVEKSQALAVGQTLLTNAQFQTLCQFLEIPTARIRALYLEIARYPEEARQYFHEQQFSLKQIERLRSLKIPNLMPWISLARQLRIKAPEFQQIIEMVWDIAVREECSIEECYSQLQIDTFLEESWTVQQKVQRLKQFLFDRRYPLLTTLRKRIEQQTQRLQRLSALPIRVQWDRNMEDLGIWLQIYLKDANTLKTLEEMLKNSEFQKAIKQLFEAFTQIKE